MGFLPVPKWLAILSCALGAALVVAGIRQSARGRETRTWTRTAGRVLASYVEEEHGGPEEQGWPRFRFVIRYAYEARGRHESEQVWIGSTSAPAAQDREWHQKWVDRFPAGREVDVWFDPADPRRAVLVRGVPRGEVATLVVLGTALVGVGLFFLARMPPR
jgi:hypothetical protein